MSNIWKVHKKKQLGKHQSYERGRNECQVPLTLVCLLHGGGKTQNLLLFTIFIWRPEDFWPESCFWKHRLLKCHFLRALVQWTELSAFFEAGTSPNSRCQQGVLQKEADDSFSPGMSGMKTFNFACPMSGSLWAQLRQQCCLIEHFT